MLRLGDHRTYDGAVRVSLPQSREQGPGVLHREGHQQSAGGLGIGDQVHTGLLDALRHGQAGLHIVQIPVGSGGDDPHFREFQRSRQ